MLNDRALTGFEIVTFQRLFELVLDVILAFFDTLGSGFVAIFGSMLALYAKGWLRALWALHCAWVGGLLGVPFCLAIFRACEALGWPLDAVTLALLGWNHTAAGTLLTHWALLWLRRNRVQLGSDEAIVAYLDRGAGASAEGTPWSALSSLLAEEQMQLLNLAHAWLSTVLPHVLSKVP